MRENVSVLIGSGANIVVLSGDRGKFLVDAGISVSEAKMKAALNTISPTPISYVVNTHWHWDHTDGDGWMQQSGATVIAHQNTRKHLSAPVISRSFLAKEATDLLREHSTNAVAKKG